MCALKLGLVRPTQFTYGALEVDCKVNYVESLGGKDLDKYIYKNPAPTWIGPSLDGNEFHFYITDGHHLARTIYDANTGDDQADKYICKEEKNKIIF